MPANTHFLVFAWVSLLSLKDILDFCCVLSKKPCKIGVVSVQIIEKSSLKYRYFEKIYMVTLQTPFFNDFLKRLILKNKEKVEVVKIFNLKNSTRVS